MDKNMKDIESILWNMQCELRNREGITGINAMHHINLILLISSFNEENCIKLGIPIDFCFENIKNLPQNELYIKIYNVKDINNCLLRYIRYNNKFGYNKDIPFEIKNESTLHNLVTKVQEMNSEFLFEKIDIIGDIYESFINREGKTMRDLGQYFTDRTLINYLVELCDPIYNYNKIESIYDGASGTGGFLTQAIKYLNNKYNNSINWNKNKYNIYGSDINRNTYVLLKLNMYFTFGHTLDNLTMEDSLVNESLKENGYDIILMNPPFGVKGLKYTNMNKKIKDLGINGTKGEILFLQNCMVNLAEKGRCCIIVPEGVLFNSTKMYKNTRKYLVENFELNKIIKVGNGSFFKNTGVNTAVLFFSNTGKKTSKVDFVQVDKIGDKIDEKHLKTISIDEIIENNYSFNLNLFIKLNLNIKEEYSIINFEQLFTLEKGKIQSSKVIYDTDGIYPFINKGSIETWKKVNESNCALDGENIFIAHISNGNGTLPIKYYNGKCNFTNLLYVININNEYKNQINKKFYYYYLLKNKKFIEENCQTGACTKSLKIDLINKIPVPLPPITLQNNIVSQLDNIYEQEIMYCNKNITTLKISMKNIIKNIKNNVTIPFQNLKIKDLFYIVYGNKEKENIGEDLYGQIGGGSKIVKYDNKWNVSENNIIISRSGSCGKVNMFNKKILVGSYAYVLFNNNKYNFNYSFLYYYLKANQHDLEYLSEGSVVKNLNRTILGEYNILLPPIELQNKIVKDLDLKTNLINLLQDNIDKASIQADDIMNIIFN